MEHFEKNGGYRMLTRVVAMCLALAVCLPLTLTASASVAETTETAATMPTTQETTASDTQEPTEAPQETMETPQEIAEAVQETSETTEPDPEVLNAEIETAMGALRVESGLDDNEWSNTASTLETVEKSRELLEAIQDYTIALRKRNELEKTQMQLAANGLLNDEAVKTFWNQLVEENKRPTPEGIKEKIQKIIQDPATYLETPEGIDGQEYVEWAKECSALAEDRERWDALEKRIDKLVKKHSQLLEERENQAESAADFISSRIAEIDEKKSNLEKKIKDYLTSPPDGQGGALYQDETLSSQLQELEDEVDMLWLEFSLLLMETDGENDQARKKLEGLLAELQQQTGETKSRQIFGFIALGVSVLAVIMGIVATVLALRQPSEPEEEPEEMASRRDVEALEKQNTYLRNRLDKLEKRTDDANASVQKHMDQLRGALRKELEQRKTDNVVVEPPPPPPPPKIALRLNYQSISPQNSYLTEDKAGIYQLWADNTVTLKPESMFQMNELGSWRASGLLYMYWPVVNGRELNPDDILPGGFYQPQEILKPARVRKNNNGTYALAERGSVKMKAY